GEVMRIDTVIACSFDDSYRAARLLIRVHGRPVGYADLAAEILPTLDHARLLATLDPETIERARSHLIDDLTLAGFPVPDQPADLIVLLDQVRQAELACPRAPVIDGPLVSVAVCTRDRVETIGATLQSLERQTYRNMEVLVVDNAPSSDTTERLVRAHFPHVR